VTFTRKYGIKLTFDAKARPNLVLPLGRHHLGVGAGDQDASVQASLVVSFDNITAHDFAGSDTAVVRTLRARETALWPAIGPSVKAKEGVFLLETEPELMLLICVHDDLGFMSEVEAIGLTIRHPGLAHDKDIAVQTNGIWEESLWA
jgi:hypothetical protein